MKRRQLIGYGLTGAASTAALTACAQSTTPIAAGDGEALPTVRWKMATSWPKSLDTLYGAAEIVCDRIAAMTDGRFTIEPMLAEKSSLLAGARCGPRRHRRMWPQRCLLLRWQKRCPCLWHHRPLWPQCPAAKCLVVPRRRSRSHAKGLRQIQCHQLSSG